MLSTLARTFDGIPLLPKMIILSLKFTGIKTETSTRRARAHVQGAQIMPGARYQDVGSQINQSSPEKKQHLTKEEYYQKLGFETGPTREKMYSLCT